MWNNHLAGVYNPNVYLKATELQIYKEFGDSRVLLNVSKNEADEIIKLAKENQVLRGGQYHGDIERTLENELKHESLRHQVSPTVAGGKVASVI